MDTNKLTNMLGLALALLHQVGIVGTIPQTKEQWIQTGISIGLGLLGYFSNKLPVPQVPQP